MSATNHTQNYDLSQFVGGDIPSWLNDYNGDMSKIDSAIAGVASGAGDVASDVNALKSRMTSAEADIDTAESNIATLQNTVSTQGAQITQNTTNITTTNSNVSALDTRVTALEQGGGVDIDERLNADGTSQGTPFYFDEQNGVYGFNTSSNRGADTFHPFKSTVDPSKIDDGTLDPNGSATVTIDPSKSYVVSVARKYSFTTEDTVLYIAKIVNGVATVILTASSYTVTCTVSGTTLTITTTTGSYCDYGVVEC